MASNDPVVGAMLFAVKQLVRQVEWSVAPATGAAVDATQAEATRDFVRGALFEDMSHTWQDALGESLSMLTYGWAYLELVYKRRLGDERDPSRRSRFTDGRIGWRKWSLRGQETLDQWQFDEADGIQGLWQVPPAGQAGGRARVLIPIEKALLFRTISERNNPEGLSVLRTAYRSWYFKRRIEEIEGIGIERDLAGLPVLKAPEKGINPWDASDPKALVIKDAAERLIRNIKRDEQEGVFLPFGWELSLLTTGGRRNFDTTAILERYDTRIAMSLLADFILLGHQQVGSWALSSDKTRLFAVALGAILDAITTVVNRHAIPRLLALNGLPVILAPTLQHGDLETPDLDALGGFVQRLASVGAIRLTPQLEQALLQAASLPVPDLQDPTVGKKLRKGVKLTKREQAMVETMASVRESLQVLKTAALRLATAGR